MAKKSHGKKAKKINYTLIDPGKANNPPEPWKYLRECVEAHHPHLAEAKFALAWQRGMKADKDDNLTLGRCRKASDLSRELAEYDFIILLNEEAWQELYPDQRKALIDHELTHAQVTLDEDGEVKLDERGRPVWRIRRHDIEEFKEIIERHGLYKSDLEAFVKAALAQKKTPLFPEEEKSVAGKVG